jgi:hypothetical protein
MTTIIDISSDILFDIFSRLEIKDLVITLPLVCKRFNHIIKDPYMWFLIFDRNMHSKFFHQLFGSPGTYRSYSVTSFTCTGYIPQSVLSYQQCHHCQKYVTNVYSIHRCHCGYQTCKKCAIQISTYHELCMRCAHVVNCHQCQHIVPRGQNFVAICCQRRICEGCANNPHLFRIINRETTPPTPNTPPIIRVICREHTHECNQCHHWFIPVTTETYVTSCCHQTICPKCIVICRGCGTNHCKEHCHDNKCTLSGCCMVHSKTPCKYNGSICTDCSHNINTLQMTCHPVVGHHGKYCETCFHKKTWICKTCNQIMPLTHCQTCDCCSKTMCRTHLRSMHNGAKFVCHTCYGQLTGTCDICLEIYTLNRLCVTDNMTYCPQCATKWGL